ncbi:MAG: UvrD-helicase domain-containing protein [Atopobiaceae bacterium]|nr:UvrD-helicase domain-containing protein [Atopobiaceae bacterium]
MAARRLTDDQLKIVETLDRPLFVAAGAGSGKSSTLAERVAWALDPDSGSDGLPFIQSLDQVLVITFTRAAAEEIKEKIRERLREGGMEEHALAVDAAWISTIHGMCSRILRRHAFDLGIDPQFTVLEASDASVLVERATDEVLREVRANGAFPELFSVFPLRSAKGDDAAGTVFGMVRDVRDAAGSALEGFSSVRFRGAAPNVASVLSHLRDESERALVIGRAEGAFLTEKGALEETRLEHDLAELEECLRLSPSQLSAGAPALMERLSKPMDAYRKKAMKEVGADLKKAYAEAVLVVPFSQMGPLAQDVLKIARMVDERYVALKQELGALDNDDLLSRTFDAFREHPEIAAEYGSKFRLVMVDEFQDTNAQQVKMIELLSGKDACHLTTVGDAQQSIYRFRAADVQVFRDREATSDPASHVHLTMNFRSHADVLSFVERALSGAPLPDFMRLDPCPTRPDGLRARTLPRVDVEVLSTTYTKGANSPARAAAMAAMIADRIRERIEAGERPEDVALLLGVMRNLDVYLDALRLRGVECVVSGGSTFSQAPEVGVVAALLHVLANPKDTSSGLFPVLVSELFSLEADDLCVLATKQQETVDAFAKRGIEVGLLGMDLPGGVAASKRLALAHDVLTRALERLGTWRMADVLQGVLLESGWVSRCHAEGPDGEVRLANALAAVRYASDLAEAGGLGPARAAVEFDHWLALSKVGPASLSGGDSGAVQVMTVHATKGLEYPLVAIAECWGRSTTRPIVGFAHENQAGWVDAALIPPDTTAANLLTEVPDSVTDSSDSLDWARFLVNASRERDQAELARLLYVAITRARESVILGMSVLVKSKGDMAPQLASDVVGTLFSGSLPPLGEGTLDYGGNEPARVRHVCLVKTDDGVAATPDECSHLAGDGAGAEGDSFFQLFEVDPDAVPASSLSQALSAKARQGVFSYSSAHAQMQDAWRSSEVPQHDPDEAAELSCAPTLVTDDEDIDAPDDAADADKATNLGSAFHELAQTMVEAGGDHDPARLDALARHWHLSARQRARLEESIGRWERSDLRAEALSYDLVQPEVPFFIRVDSQYGTYVEGAIDLLCRNRATGEALVVDYKTGDVGLTLDEVRSRHEMQANFYAHVMMSQGCDAVECAFVCVELEAEGGQPVVVRYAFDKAHPPKI